ncbi:MAG: hypothetical protein IJ736_08470 [Firmicutes bacterium]|nr:hypothetical protein [Bacillota bacterium]
MSTYRVRLGVSLILNVILAAVMPEIVYQTYIERGCELHFGGEWLLLWFVVIIVAWMFFGRER